MHHLYL